MAVMPLSCPHSSSRWGKLRRPQVRQLRRQRLERLAFDHRVPAPSADQTITLAVQAQHFERLDQWIEQPHVRDVPARVNRQPHGAIEGLGGRRNHFTEPIWSELERGGLREIRQAFAAPTRNVREQHVTVQV